MPKDFTDYIPYIFGAGDRVFYTDHLRVTKHKDFNHEVHELNGHKYLLELDRAYKVRWAPWSKIMHRRPKVIKSEDTWYFRHEDGVWGKARVVIKTEKERKSVSIPRTLNEFLRSKKIGLILYQEPCTLKCATCKVKGIPEAPNERSYDICVSLKVIPDKVEPMHISRTHQPSGEMRG